MSQENAMQDDYIIEEHEEFVPPELGHVELVFQALSDTVNEVAGTEGLTVAQTYLHAVLGASGTITYAQSIKGAEGFFANVKEGAKKAIEYIKKMFKDIWGFFFKQKGPEEAKAVKKEIADKKVELKDPEKVKSGLQRAVAGSDSKELGEHISKATGIEQLDALSKDVAKANSKAQQALIIKINQFVEALEDKIKFAAEVETQAKASAEDAYISWASSVKGSVSNAQSLITSLKGVRDVADLKAAETILEGLNKHVDEVLHAIEASAKTESRVQSMIDALSKLDDNTNATDEQKKAGDKDLNGLKLFVKSAARYSALLKRTLSHMKAVNTAVGKVFGL